MNWKNDKIDLTGVVVLLIVVSATIVASTKLIGAKKRRILRENAMVEVYTAKLAEARAVTRKLDATLAANQQALAAMREQIPEPGHIGVFLEELDAVMQNNGAKLHDVHTEPAVKEPTCTRTPVGFSCSAPFQDIHAALHGLENLERFVRVEWLSLNRPAPDRHCAMQVKCNILEQ